MADPISRRGLLQLSYSAATVWGISNVAAAETVQASDHREQASAVAFGSGLQLHYREDWLGAPWIEPEAALLIHGNLESGEVWFGWLPQMAQQFRVFRPDLPGFGQSKAPADFDWTVENLATVLANFLDKVGLSSAHIVGAKTGGVIAMQFAAAYPQKTRSLILASGPFAPVDPKFENAPQSQRLGSSATAAEIEYFDRLKAATSHETRIGVAKVLAKISLEDVLPRIKAPTLVITSDRSALQSVEMVLRYQPKIPNSRLLVLTSDAYHVAVANAEQCVTNSLAFIRETRPKTAT
ncbi:MAG: alpha/beta hydrolase [Candidatus Acidiferrales bacterium]|jgi:pimeloyl-ACP methyl ester carboxylesterase